MKELNDIVTTKLATMIDDGSIEKMIEGQLEKLMQSTIKSAMESYSDFGKSLTRTIEMSIGTSLNQVSFPEYNHFVAQLVQEKYGQALDQQAAPLLEELLKNELSPVPEELDAQEMLEEVKRCWKESAHEAHAYEIEIDWDEHGEDTIFMTLKHPEFESDNIKVTFYNFRETDGNFHIGYISESDNRISGSISGATHAMGLAGYFYKLYCRKTKISGLQNIYGDNIEVCDY
ncbi:hypothetical protein [Photobacterium alginatilyticum]|uniref:Uncharacterized protein n=1 Tax=Photobacterium alginatilyticum TaxID=1775171 RepID=A0ABW9YNR0_9GAMM|nr:hypothetical protein [Photobacterium alginatilyticum]NBI54679.1 hypothetical protein [Photobacterium alginatilyticum]